MDEADELGNAYPADELPRDLTRDQVRAKVRLWLGPYFVGEQHLENVTDVVWLRYSLPVE
jgi:hypothetical protein